MDGLNFEKGEMVKMERKESVYVRILVERLEKANGVFENLNNEFYSANARLGCAEPLPITEEKCLDGNYSTVVAKINEQLDQFLKNIHDYERRMDELKEFV
jgi:hypothetical protein